ncbi:MAG: hypothetical protein VX379_09355 [Pseudomonadota bacterium]|uniref:hypothetical protein n=1 Tax=Alcanivorax sp. TaxID=1872427 RepID=UPI0025C5676A|nr:hypothetical protein [Alcanivorax sp.]MED5239767.1 hypothetical protein [Pseudomonadota bacterium]MEE3319777.1 hypothetical protein [Pseudomonadota bacterium]
MEQWAPQYSRRERLTLLALHGAWAVPLLLVSQWLFFPWLETFVATAPCRQVGPFSAMGVLLYGIFVGLPGSFVLVVLAIEGRHSLRVWQLAQHPLPGEKVLKPTRYVYGRRARLRPLMFLLVMLAVTGLAVQGLFWAGDFLDQLGPAEGC